MEATVTHLSPLDSLTSLDHFHFPAPVFLPNEDGPAVAEAQFRSPPQQVLRLGAGGWGLGAGDGADCLRSG